MTKTGLDRFQAEKYHKVIFKLQSPNSTTVEQLRI